MRPITPILDRPDVTEVAINRPGEILAKTFKGWEHFAVEELAIGKLQALITALSTFNGMQPRPIMSVVLPGGERGQIVRPPACLDGTVSINIRKHASKAYTLEELAANGAFEGASDVSLNKPTEAEVNDYLARTDFGRLDAREARLLAIKRDGDMRAFLEACVIEKRNMVIAGKTGSGKTTFGRSLIEKVPSHERLITIEDVHELKLEGHPNRVHMLYGDGTGRVSAFEALKSCMRQSPDRIMLAELRGEEAWEYVNSLNTGHPGSITTVHANSAIDTFERIATLVKSSKVGQQLDMAMIRRVLFQTINVVLYFHEFRLEEVYFDPIYARQQTMA